MKILPALLLLALAMPAVRASDASPWLEARSPHFVVISNAGAAPARRAALEFERVRGMLRRALTNAQFDSRQPIVVLAVSGESGLRELLPQYWERKGQHPVAVYWGGPNRHCIVLRVDASDRERSRRVLHEYVHLLTHVNVPDLPPWLDEGLSEFWGTAQVDGDALEVGRPSARHLKVLQGRRTWIPFGELLDAGRVDARDAERVSLFYAESWALTHYLMLGGTPPSPSTPASLDLAPSAHIADAAQLQEAVAPYVRAARFRVLRIGTPRPNVDPTRDEGRGLRVTPLAEAQSLAVRAGCLAEGERPAAAEPLLTRARAADPGNVAALETLGYLRFEQNKPGEAAGWFDRAIASGSASHLAYFYRAILSGPVPSLSVRETDYLKKAIELDPGFAPAYVRLADSYAGEAGRLQDAVALMRRATDLEPGDPAYWVALGRLLAGANRPAEAREAGERGLAVARSGSSRALVEGFLAELERGALMPLGGRPN